MAKSLQIPYKNLYLGSPRWLYLPETTEQESEGNSADNVAGLHARFDYNLLVGGIARGEY